MRLNQDLAQRVVDKTMNVLGKNINIMNHEGIIIGSGDKKRLNTFHEVAKEVVESGTPCIISSEEASKFQGVKAGINLPVKFQEDIIGVVGITGKVEEVKGYGQIVKNMVELILQQEFLRREVEIKNKARENFFQQLIGNSISSRELLKDKIQLYNINTNIYRVIMLIN
ncbi:MAG: sugar diacid recognition domain-containing protein, partial [Halanaerobiaceae bacterium]